MLCVSVRTSLLVSASPDRAHCRSKRRNRRIRRKRSRKWSQMFMVWCERLQKLWWWRSPAINRDYLTLSDQPIPLPHTFSATRKRTEQITLLLFCYCCFCVAVVLRSFVTLGLCDIISVQMMSLVYVLTLWQARTTHTLTHSHTGLVIPAFCHRVIYPHLCHTDKPRAFGPVQPRV